MPLHRQKSPASDRATALAAAARTLEIERAGLEALLADIQSRLADPFAAAVDIMLAAKGRVIVTGIGKSGHIGQKIAATLASTGRPASFVHPSEASHGDLGMITRDDCVLAMSWSGETVELHSIISYSRRFKVPLIAITSRRESALGAAADVVIELPRAKEACPHGLAPTTSTTMQLALGDCLAVALLEAAGFSAADFKIFHPGGALGSRLKHVSDLMHDGDQLPLADEAVPMTQALVTMTERAFGCLGVIDSTGALIGIVTDGDLRRHMGARLLTARAGEIMTRNPLTIGPEALASTALEMMNARRITALFVVDGGRPVGILHVHDLLRAGVV